MQMPAFSLATATQLHFTSSYEKSYKDYTTSYFDSSWIPPHMAEGDGNSAEKMADTTDARSDETQEAAATTTQIKEVETTSATFPNERESLPPAIPTSKLRKRRQSTFPSNSCAMCPGEGEIICSICDSIKYCSTQCQESDEPIHKMVCESFSSLQEPPTESYRRAILFDETPEDATPRFVWLRVHTNVDEDSREYDQPILGEFLKDKNGRVRSTITKNHVLWRPLNHSIHIEHYPDSSVYQRNSAVSNVMDYRYTTPTTWSGTILAYGTEGKSRAPPKLIDLDLQDFRHIVDSLNTSNSSALDCDIRYFGKTLQGVRLNCKGDIADPGSRPAIEAVSVPLTHCVFDDSMLLPIPSKMDIPILAARYPRKPEYERNIQMYKDSAALSSTDEEDFNPIARDLQQTWLLQGDELHATTSTISLNHEPRNAYYQGTMILARQDHKPLFPQQSKLFGGT